MKTSQKSITVNHVPIVWNEEGKGYTFFGLDAITFWTNPSLLSILGPLRNELGSEFYSLIIAYEASKSTYEDYHSMVDTMSHDFCEGFLKWGDAVSAAGWGSFSILSVDFANKQATVQIDDPWEMRILTADSTQDSVPFLSGKISGIFSHAFQTNCLSETLVVSTNPNRVILKVAPSIVSLEQALLTIQHKRKLSENVQLKANNSSLIRSQRKLDDILTTIGERIWETDEHLIVRDVSVLNVSKLKLTKDAIIGQSILKFFHPEDILLFQSACEQLKIGRLSVAELKIRVLNPDEESFWTNFKFKSVSDFSGNHCGFLGSARDISDEVLLATQMEEQRQKSIHSSKMASLGEMASSIAHEINNPLSEIVANAWHIRDLHENGALTTEELVAGLDTIEKTGHRIAEVIKGMRSFSRDASHDLFSVAFISSIIKDTLVFCKKRFVSHGIRLETLISDEKLALSCRPTQIGQVLLNVLNNAFDAVLPMSEKWVEIEVEDLGEVIEIRVTDSGPGMSQETKNKLMQPFFTTKDPGKGTGLGLAISRGIVESHGGRFFVDEKSSQTRFVVQLPKAR